ncbi:MAG: DUF502 domain-containing protein [Bacteroidia bacterium]
MKKNIARLLNFFLKGLLVILPIAITYVVIKSIVIWVDSILNIGIPALGFFIVVITTILVGWIGTSIITAPIMSLLDDVLSHIPFVKIIYTSVKDFMEAFVGEKKKFTQPVVVELNKGVFKPGFITHKDLSSLNLPDLVAVYFPHSYAFSGNVFFVEKEKVKPLDINVTNAMKFIISGGVTDIE